MELECSLPHLQISATCTCPEQLDPVHTPTSHFLKIHLNIILIYTPGSSKWFFASDFPTKTPYTTFLSPYVLHSRLSHSFLFDHPKNIGWGVLPAVIFLLIICMFVHPEFTVSIKPTFHFFFNFSLEQLFCTWLSTDRLWVLYVRQQQTEVAVVRGLHLMGKPVPVKPILWDESESLSTQRTLWLKLGDLRQTHIWLQIILVFGGNWSLRVVQLLNQQNQYIL